MTSRMRAALIALQVLIVGSLVTGAILLLTISDGDARPSAVPKPKVDRFDAARAYSLAQRQGAPGPRPAAARAHPPPHRQVARAPRPPLSAAQRKAAAFLRAGLPNGRFED